MRSLVLWLVSDESIQAGVAAGLEPQLLALRSMINARCGAGECDLLLVAPNTDRLVEYFSHGSVFASVTLLQFSIEQSSLESGVSQIANWLRAHQNHIQFSKYDFVVTESSALNNLLLSVLAPLVNVEPMLAVVDILDSTHVTKAIYSGQLLGTYVCKSALQCLSVQPSTIKKFLGQGVGGVQTRIEVRQMFMPISLAKSDYGLNAQRRGLCGYHSEDSLLRRLLSAQIIVAGGRGVGPSGFPLLEKLASLLRGEVGATRGAIDMGWASADLQIGQTGLQVAPECYIAVGISGALQHLAGIRQAKMVIAINRDANAPIMQVADYALIGDCYEVCAALLHKFSCV